MAMLLNSTTGAIVATWVDRRTSFIQRVIGLLGLSGLERGKGIWLTPCGAIHTIGLRFPIDAIFVDRDGCVLRLAHDIMPNVFALFCPHAVGVVELGGGALRQTDVLVGDRLELI